MREVIKLSSILLVSCILAGCLNTSTKQTSLSSEYISSQIDSLVNSYYTMGELSGSVLVAD